MITSSCFNLGRNKMHIKQWIFRSVVLLVLAGIALVFLTPIANPLWMRADADGFGMFGSVCLMLIALVGLVLSYGQLQYVILFMHLHESLEKAMKHKTQITLSVGQLSTLTIRHYNDQYRVIVQEADSLDRKVFIVTKAAIEAYVRTVKGVSTPILPDGSFGEVELESGKEDFDPDFRKEMNTITVALTRAYLNP